MEENEKKWQPDCPGNHTFEDIYKAFPFDSCDSCPHRKYDSDDGVMYCSEIQTIMPL